MSFHVNLGEGKCIVPLGYSHTPRPPRTYFLGTGAFKGPLRTYYLGTWGARVQQRCYKDRDPLTGGFVALWQLSHHLAVKSPVLGVLTTAPTVDGI